MRTKLFFTLIFCLALCTPATAQFYKYTDSEGNIRFTDDLSKVPENLRSGATPYEALISPPETPPASMEQEKEDNKGATDTDMEALNQEKQALEEKESKLNAEYKGLMERRASLEKEKKGRKTRTQALEYNKSVEKLNQEVLEFDERRKAFQAEVKAFNERVKGLSALQKGAPGTPAKQP